jgi:hypothetical protein
MSNDMNLARHRAKCGICSHPQRHEIEQEFVNWGVRAGSQRFSVSVATQFIGMHGQQILRQGVSKIFAVPLRKSSSRPVMSKRMQTPSWQQQ